MPKGLYAIVDASFADGVPLPKLAEDYLRGGASIIQLRDKNRKSSKQTQQFFFETAQKITQLKNQFSFLFIVNDDPTIAREVGADGVHIGKDDASIAACRTILPKPFLIGYSSHSLEEAIDAEKRGADYVAFGAIYPTATKGPGHPVQGVEKLKEVVSRLSVPVIAIGGIGRHNIEAVLKTNVAGVAMITGLSKAANRVEETRYFHSLVDIS